MVFWIENDKELIGKNLTRKPEKTILGLHGVLLPENLRQKQWHKCVSNSPGVECCAGEEGGGGESRI